MIAPKFKATAPKGIWSPSTTPTPARKNPTEPGATSTGRPAAAKSPAPTPPPPPTFWAPSPSPTAERKEFRPVKFESPQPGRKVYTAAAPAEAAGTSPPWTQQQQAPERLTNAQSAPFRVADAKTTSARPQPTAATSAPQQHHKVHFAEPSAAAAPQPVAGGSQQQQSLTSRSTVQESHRSYSQQQTKIERHHQQISSSQSQSSQSSSSQQQQNQSAASSRSNEVNHPIQYADRVNEATQSSGAATAATTASMRQQTTTEAEAGANQQQLHRQHQQQQQQQQQQQPQPQSVASAAPKRNDIGPTTKEGMPIILRSEVDEDLHHKWYKRMYNTLHKVPQHDESVTVRYKTRRGRYPYKSNGYLSEPEPQYDDSDYATKYSTLDRRRIAIAGDSPPDQQQHQQQHTTSVSYAAGRHHQLYNDDKHYGTLPNPVKCGAGVYKNQPGRIENFLPGQLSVSEKERKDRLEQERSVPRAYHEGYLSKALKDQGYESDSTLVFRKREQQQISQLNSEQQKQAYLSLQAGGEVPVHGFRKPAPEKPKEFGHDCIEYYPITATLTKLRVPREVLCYPIANISRPIDMFGAFPPPDKQQFVPASPPTPPCRKSSRRSTTLRIYTGMREQQQQLSQQQQQRVLAAKKVTVVSSSPPPPLPPPLPSTAVLAQRKCAGTSRSSPTTTTTTTSTPTKLSKSASWVYSSSSYSANSTQKEAKNQANHSRVTRKQAATTTASSAPSVATPRRPSVSPVDRRRKSSASPIAFGRSISKERTFAEEKKRLEQAMPMCRRRGAFAGASTSILRNPDLKSPDEVKRAIKTTFQMPIPVQVQLVSAAGVERMRPASAKLGRKPSAAVHNKRTMSVTMSNRRENVRSPTGSTLIKCSSNVSLTRTNSTFSIDSSGSNRRQSPRSPPTIRGSPQAVKRGAVIVVNGKQRRKKSTSKEKLNASPTIGARKSVQQQLHDSINAEIHSQNWKQRNTSFFQKLFLKDVSMCASPPPLVVGAVQHRVNVWDKILDPPRTVPAASAPIAPAVQFLRERRPVTASPFHHLDAYEQRMRQSRSLSPQRRYRQQQQKQQHRETYVHFQCDSVQDLSPLRSRSVPAVVASKLCLTEVIQPDQPHVILGRNATGAIGSPRTIRSPSCRRIHSHRTTNVQTSQAPKIRARSAGVSKDEDERRFNSLDSALITSRSIGTLNVRETTSSRCYENHSAYCHCTQRSQSRPSERFRDLNKFYADLERVAQLEKATSSTDIRPIRRRGEVIDFEEWRRLRQHERAEKELNVLKGRIKQDEREKDLLFRSRYPEDSKWSEQTDLGLRCKEKSVEDLKDILMEKTWQDRSNAETTESDKYKSLWRGSSVLDVASNMETKYNADATSVANVAPPTLKRATTGLGISERLIGSLSEDQVSRIETQLSEIYSEPVQDANQYFVNVRGDKRTESHAGLTVRCNSAISKEELLGPMLMRHQARVAENVKSVVEAPKPTQTVTTTTARVSRSVDRFEHIIREEQRALSESEKRSIMHDLSQEIRDKVKQRQRSDSGHNEVIVPKETRGAVASSKAALKVNQLPINDEADFLEHTSEVFETNAHDAHTSEEQPVKETRKVDNAIEYFERKREEPPPEPTVYKACDYSSPDEEEVMRLVEERMQQRRLAEKKDRSKSHSPERHSSSVSDFKEIFGETRRSITPLSDYRPLISNQSSCESVFRSSRSVSPIDRKSSWGPEVRRIKTQYESLSLPKRPKRYPAQLPVQRHQSDSELHRSKPKPLAIAHPIIRRHEAGDVTWITHKFETRNAAASRRSSRSRSRHVRSPVQKIVYRKAADRFMPHIDIISKTVALKHDRPATPAPIVPAVLGVRVGDVRKKTQRFEDAAAAERMSMLGQMYTSSPDVRELRNITSYLAGDWVAHRYPHRNDNARSVSSEARCIKTVVYRAGSASPPRIRSRISPLLKPFYRRTSGWQDDEEAAEAKRTTRREQEKAEHLWRKLNSQQQQQSVKFKGFTYDI